FNSGNGFYSNNIFNFFCAADSSFGVNLWSGTTNTSISDNSFYRTNDLTVFGGETFQSAIFVREQLSLGWNVITGNYIGGKAPQATGGRFTLFATQYKFEGITIYSPAQLTAGEANQVYANTIRLIQIGATGHSSGETFCGIKIHNSASYTINNTIGRPDGYESIIVSSSGANSTFTCKGIDYKGLPQSISYNKIGGFKLSSGIGTIAGGFTAINLVDSTASGEFAITDNQIGGNAGYPKSIESNAPQAVAFQVRGIALANEYSSVYCRANAISGIQHGTAAISTIPQPLSGIVKTGNGPASILYNTIAELQASSSEADTSITFPAFTGISVLQGTSNAVGHNTIRELRSVYFSQSAGSAGLAGILVSENASASVYSNYLYGFRSINVYPSFTAVLTGILARGSATISNNTLSFSNRSAEYGSNDLYNCVITGIMAGAPAATLNVYHNSIYIGGDNGEGTNTGWSAPVSMLASSGAPLHLRNNVLVNERTGGNAAHYIFYNAASSPAASWPVTTSDYNLIVALYPDQFGRWGSSNLDSTQWKANGGDAHSTFATIAQIAPSDLFSDKFADLAIQQSAQQYVAGKGITGTGITEDITEAIRSTTAPSLGAYEYEVATLTITSYGGADSAAVNVAENQTAVATVTATHSNPDATITYSLAGGDDDAYFTINDATGELSFVSTPDFWQPSDSDGDNVYLVSVQASDGTLTDVQVIAVTVTDVYEAPPPGITLFQEDFDNITSAFPAGWTLVDVDQMTPSQYIFDLFPNAWNRLPKTSMYPDDPETDTCAWATSWFDYGSNDPADDWMWTPAIDLSGSNIQLSWKAKGAGTYEVRIMTTAPSGSTGNMGNMLSSAVLFSEGIQNFTGVVHSADLSAYSGQKVYIGFRHTSGAGDYVLAIDDVTVKTNFAITSTHTDTIFRNTDAISLPENTTAVTTVAATDETGGSVSYNITGGADAAKFSINNSTGVLSFITAPDFEAPEDAGTNNVYEVTVQATNGTLTDVQTIAVTITDVADAAVLAITSYAGAASATVNVAENQTLVTTVTATYSDPAGVITFSLVGHDDDSYFTVNTTTGELSFVNAPDFERPSDPDENNMYMVTVEASVGGLTAVQRFKVRVTNVNDNAPEFGSFDGDASVTLSIPENTTAVGTVWAVDKEPGTTITYSVLSNNEGALFSINPATGVLRFITAPDYENPADQYRGNVYIVFVQASDGQLNSVQRFKIKVKDVNEGTGRMSNNTTGMAQASGEMQSGKGISIFPNPVTGKRFTLRVTDLSAGNYTLELYTTNGQLACRQTLNHTAKSTSYPIQLPATLTKGMYVLKLAGAGLVHSEKLLID
ncbi:MAG: cadherin domain-containing protein, partial [Chitinophagaceae bacterium]